MTPSSRYFSRLVVLAAILSSATSFSTFHLLPTTTTRPSFFIQQHASMAVDPSHQQSHQQKQQQRRWRTKPLSLSQSEVILREFEKKEARLQKQREEAMAKLTEYEDTLEKLRMKKTEYLAASQVAEPPAGGTFSETALRSAVKAFAWRIIAGSVTFVTTLKFSGSVQSAFKVVGADFFSKSFTMFIGERLMNKSKAGRNAGSDGAGRSLAKALIWRLFAIANTLTFAIFVAKDLSIATKIASTDAVFKTALMYFYERVWARVEWGKEYLLEYAL